MNLLGKLTGGKIGFLMNISGEGDGRERLRSLVKCSSIRVGAAE